MTRIYASHPLLGVVTAHCDLRNASDRITVDGYATAYRCADARHRTYDLGRIAAAWYAQQQGIRLPADWEDDLTVDRA